MCVWRLVWVGWGAGGGPPPPTTSDNQPFPTIPTTTYNTNPNPSPFPPNIDRQNKQDGWDLDIKEDVEDECGRYGSVKHVLVDVKAPGGLVYVLFGEEPVRAYLGLVVGGGSGDRLFWAR